MAELERRSKAVHGQIAALYGRFVADWRKDTWEQDGLAGRWHWKEPRRSKAAKVVEIRLGRDFRAYLVVRDEQNCLWFLLIARKTGNKKDQDDEIDRAMDRTRDIQED